MKNRRLKILISAYACSPYKGSEPGVGWGFVSTLAKHHDLWVVVEEEKFQDDIERALATNPALKQTVRFYFIHKKRNRTLRKIWPPSYYWYYRRWHVDAYHLARQLHAEIGFDVAHQLTMVGFREPGYLWKLGIPFIWGPVGGLGLFPWRFLSKVGIYGALYYIGYNIFNLLHMHFLSRPRSAALSARAGLIAATPENRHEARKIWGCDSTVISEVGLPHRPADGILPKLIAKPLRIVWTGLHTPRKALNLALEALAQLPEEVAWELHILGEGRRTSAWQNLSTKLGINKHCYFHGWQPRDKALRLMQEAHLMLITSLRDLTSTVTIEALTLGLPIACLDHCGLAEVVNDSCGIKIPVTTPKQVVRGIAAAVEKLAKDEPYRQSLAHGALARAHDFSWEKKAATLNKIYLRAIKSKQSTKIAGWHAENHTA